MKEVELGQVWKSLRPNSNFYYVIVEDYGKARPMVINEISSEARKFPTMNASYDCCGYSDNLTNTMYFGDVFVASSLKQFFEEKSYETT